MKASPSANEWEQIANSMFSNWNFPNCIGALDGKHIANECPANIGSNYCNYKKFYTLVLIAMCDSHLTCCRGTIENSFGILSVRWCIFRRPIKAKPETVDSITKACLCLLNYVRMTSKAQYVPSGFIDCEDSDGNIISGDWRKITGNSSGLMSTKTKLTTGQPLTLKM